jgi:hypothetical protein
VNYAHGGACADSSGIEVVDLWDRRMATPKVASDNKDEITLIGRLEWSSPSVLEYDGMVHGYTECRTGKMMERPIKGTVDAATLAFH